MNKRTASVFVDDGLHFPEGLRWYDGALWFSDFHRRQVMSADSSGKLTVHAYVGGQPSGLGFRPDGTPLVASSFDRHVLTIVAGQLKVFGSPGKVVVGPTNDMAVDRHGRAYVTGFGYEALYDGYDESKTTRIAMVDLDGTVTTQGDDLYMPNGIAFNADGSLLIVSETSRNRLTAFKVAADGSLSGKRLFADLGPHSPDGICVDAEGAVWVACWRGGNLIRVRDGGEIVEEIVADTKGCWVPSCALGGPDGRTLYYAVSKTDLIKARMGVSEGVIEKVSVDVPAW